MEFDFVDINNYILVILSLFKYSYNEFKSMTSLSELSSLDITESLSS